MAIPALGLPALSALTDAIRGKMTQGAQGSVELLFYVLSTEMYKESKTKDAHITQKE